MKSIKKVYGQDQYTKLTDDYKAKLLDEGLLHAGY
jgi:hypothetical protein